MEGIASSSYFGSLDFEQVLDDLSSRFIVNLPTEELESIERICFQIEQAHWYYEDFVRPQASHLPSFSLRKFSEIIFRSNPLLSHFDAATAYDQFLRYKERVPVCGAILLSSGWDKCLVVKGWKSGASWSFPRGKINQGEDERDCAVREVWEETGYDISPHFNSSVVPHPSDSATCPPPLPPGHYPDDDYLECVMKEQRIRLYIVPNVSEDTLFETKTRKEISKIAWAPLTSLPTWSKKGKTAKKDIKCYMVTPFVNPLKTWIQSHRKNITKAYQEESTTVPSTSGPSITEENPSAVQLESQTQALQDFFFGTLAETKADALSNVKSTTAPLAEHGIKVQDASSASQSTSQARYLQNLQVLSPIPKSPGRTVENLHRQIMRRGYEQAGQVLPSDYQANPSSGPSTIKAPSAFHDAFSSIGSPSFTDYRNSALSPSGFDSHSSINPVMRPVYTEAEREAARYSLLGQLASELGTPTPPSADESTDDDVTDEGTSRQESPGKDLMDLIHQQLRQVQPYGASATRAQEDGQPAGLMKVADSVKETANPYATSNTASSAAVHAALQSSPPSAPLDSAQAPTQHMLSILNGTSDAGTKMTFRQNGSTGHLQGPVTAQVSRIVTDEALPAAKNSAAHASSLLSLFNVQPRTATIPSATPTAQSSGHGDLARLFADVRL